jgi:methyl-accepting chemotaxis protein
MRTLAGIGAVVLGAIGLLLCATAIGLAWWAAVTATARIDRAAARLERGLSEVQERLDRVESRLKAANLELKRIRLVAETTAAENPELPRVRAHIERLLDRLMLTFDRADTLAESLRIGAAGLRTTADMVEHVQDRSSTTVRAHVAADKIDDAAKSLNGLRARMEALKSVKAAQLTQQMATLAREALSSSERLAEGLAGARDEIEAVRRLTAEWRNRIVFWIYVTTTAFTLVWLWCALGQLCLIGWGRRRFARHANAG